ncbi:MAG: hypothetical protein ACI4L7_01995 [Christensenellales bacterium]
MGYEYIMLSNKDSRTLSSSDYYGAEAIKITSDISKISVYPNKNTDELVINYNKDISGYVKSVNAEASISFKMQDQMFATYKDITEEYTTLIVKISEPKGWLSYENSNIKVYLPENLFNVIYVSCGKSDISLVASQKYQDAETNSEVTRNISCKHMFLQSGGDGNVVASPTSQIKTYNLQTEYGKASITGTKQLSAEQLIFSTHSGTFDFSCGGEGELSLSRGFFVNASGSPTIICQSIYCESEISTDGGEITIENVGQESSKKNIKIFANKAKINISNINGTILSDGGDGQANNVTIKMLKGDSTQISTIHSGDGNITINSLESKVALSSTLGNINLKDVASSASVYAYSTSGNINVNYRHSSTYNNGTKLQVFTKTGNIKLNNISCQLELEVLQNSPNKSCELTFTAVCNSDDGSLLNNKIEAESRDIKITFKGINDSLACRMVSKKEVSFDSSISSACSKVNTTSVPADRDNLLSQTQYSAYSKQYRIFYQNPIIAEEESQTVLYQRFGILLINASSTSVYHSIS